MYTDIDVWQKPTQFCKASILQLKNKLNCFKRKKFLKGRDMTLPAKVCIVKTMFFLVVMYRCEG